MKKIIIITGTSQGLGLHLAQQFLEAGFVVVGIARNNSIKNSQFHFLKLDLSRMKNIHSRLSSFLKLKKISLKNDQVVLINNAATVLPINYFHKVKEAEIIHSYLINLSAPMKLSQYVIEKYLAQSKHVTICNISSGAAVRPLGNWSIYCTFKSGLKMFTDCLNLDYAESNKFKAFSFFPGVMNTQMQKTIRSQKIKNFKNVKIFKDLKNNNDLLDPKFVAKVIFDIIKEPSKIKKTDYNIKDFKGNN